MPPEPVKFRDTPYLVYKDGRVYSEYTDKFIAPSKYGRYYTYGLWVNNKRLAITKHRIIAICYIPNPNNFKLVRHLDDNPENNALGNLCWGTDYDNKQDGKRNGITIGNTTSRRGELSNRSKLKDVNVYKIRERYSNGESSIKIANDYPVSVNQIQSIVAKRQWNHI